MEYRLSEYSPTERKADDREGQCNVWYNVSREVLTFPYNRSASSLATELPREPHPCTTTEHPSSGLTASATTSRTRVSRQSPPHSSTESSSINMTDGKTTSVQETFSSADSTRTKFRRQRTTLKDLY
ncbi:hypothetical protein TNCV_1303641 [Trichonephila clavipes]|nr:hypothetical protein TNCV_1303641 [Trichonephila clavipes]